MATIEKFAAIGLRRSALGTPTEIEATPQESLPGTSREKDTIHLLGESGAGRKNVETRDLARSVARSPLSDFGTSPPSDGEGRDARW